MLGNLAPGSSIKLVMFGVLLCSRISLLKATTSSKRNVADKAKTQGSALQVGETRTYSAPFFLYEKQNIPLSVFKQELPDCPGAFALTAPIILQHLLLPQPLLSGARHGRRRGTGKVDAQAGKKWRKHREKEWRKYHGHYWRRYHEPRRHSGHPPPFPPHFW